MVPTDIRWKQTVARVHAILENDLPIPLFFDVVRFDGIQSAALREHIEIFGCPLS
jgi:hypothetical protein